MNSEKINTKNGLLSEAYLEALRFTKSHYENFPVVSLFLPGHLRKHVAIVYKFARQADDYADEGMLDQTERLKFLNGYEQEFLAALEGKNKSEFWLAVRNTVTKFKLDPQNFLNLLSAFKQDVVKKRYDTQQDILDYCRRSANSVGRIILELFNINDLESKSFSDSICTALQLTNFYQDVAIDILKNRIYLPMDEMKKFNVEAEQLRNESASPELKKLLKHRVENTQTLFKAGRKLLPRLPAKLKLQIKMTILGGEKILDKIASLDYDVLNSHPKLSKFDFMMILIKALTM